MPIGIFKKKTEDAPRVDSVKQAEGKEVVTSGGFLNLEKGDFLNLSKADGNLNKVRISAGWQVSQRGADYDLDLTAFFLGENGKLSSRDDVIYFGRKKLYGATLDEDNLTGSEDGEDDENIHVDLSKIPDNIHHIKFAVVIYMATIRGQSFQNVRNASVKLINEGVNPEKEVCQFCLTTDGGKNTAVEFATLSRNGDSWDFKAVGEYSKNSIDSLMKEYQKGK